MPRRVDAEWELLSDDAALLSGNTYMGAAVRSVLSHMGLPDNEANRRRVMTEHQALVAAHVGASSNNFLSFALVVASQNISDALENIAGRID